MENSDDERLQLEERLRKKSAELKESNDLLKATMDSSVDMIQVFEAVRNEEGAIIDFVWLLNNKTAEQVYGNVIGKSLLATNPGVAQEGIFDTFRHVVETGLADRSERHYVQEQFNGWFYQSTVKLNDGVATTTHDITGWKNAEREIAQQAHFIQTIADVLPDVIKVMALPSGNIIYSNRNGMLSLGFNTGELIHGAQHGRLSQFHPDDLPLIHAFYARFAQLADDEENQVQYRLKRGEGEWLYLSVRGKVFKRNREGAVVQVLLIGEDITERRENERKLMQSRELLQSIIDAPVIGLAVYKALRNSEGEITDFVHEFINKTTRETIGQDFTGRLLTDHGPNGIKQLKNFITAIETGKPVSYVEHATLNATTHWFSFTNTPLGNDRMLHMWEDITHQKQSDIELLELKDKMARQATDKYYSIFNSIDTGFCIIELLFNEKSEGVDYRFLEANPAFLKQPALQRAISRTEGPIEPAQEAFWFKTCGEIVLTGEANRFEYLAGQSHAGIWYEVHAFRVDEPEKHRVAMLFNDITERKNYGRQQEYLLKLGDALRYISDPVEIEGAVAATAIDYFDVDRCYYCEIEHDLVIIRREAIKDGLPSVIGTYPLGRFALFKKVVEEGQPIVVDDAATSAVLDEGLRQICLGLHVISFVDVPVIKKGATVGLFCIVQSTPRRWTETEVAMASETAERAWAAVERAKSENALRKSRQQLTLSLEAARMGTFEWNSDTGQLALSLGSRQIFGLSPGDALFGTDALYKIINPNDVKRQRLIFDLAGTVGDGYYNEYRITRPANGKTAWIAEKGKAYKDPISGITTIHGVHWNITQKKMMEEALVASEKNLKELNESLEHLVQKRTHQLTKLKVNQEKEKLNAIIFTQEQERARISEGLHDGVAQLLYAAQNKLQMVAGASEKDDKALKAAGDILADAINDTRRISFELMPPTLRDYGLEACLKLLVQRVVAEKLKLDWDVSVKGRLPEKLEITLYRIVQEILNNILKHSRASEAALQVRVSDKFVNLKASDNGVGFAIVKLQSPHQGIGLQSIENRVKLMNGKMKIVSEPGKGTTIKLQLPLKQRSEPEN